MCKMKMLLFVFLTLLFAAFQKKKSTEMQRQWSWKHAHLPWSKLKTTSDLPDVVGEYHLYILWYLRFMLGFSWHEAEGQGAIQLEPMSAHPNPMFFNRSLQLWCIYIVQAMLRTSVDSPLVLVKLESTSDVKAHACGNIHWQFVKEWMVLFLNRF